MTTPPDDSQPPGTLNYQKPPRNVAKVGCLVAAIVLASIVGILCAFAILFMADSPQWDFALDLGLGIAAFTLGAILAAKHWISAALAITIAAICAFILMCGLCSQFRPGF